MHRVTSDRPLPAMEPLVSWGLGVILVLVALAIHATWGPFPVIKGGRATIETTPASYLCLVFLPFGILAGEAISSLFGSPRRLALTMAISILLLSALAVARLALWIPISGHALFVVYYLCHQLASRSWAGLPRSAPRIAVGILLALQVIYFKLWVWQDEETLAIGTLLGLGIWILSTKVAFRGQGEAG